MQDFVVRLTQITRKELFYIEGFLCMYQERYAEYQRDLNLARALGETKRAGEIEEDLHAFRHEIAYLERKHASVYERLRTLAYDERFPTIEEPTASDTLRTISHPGTILPFETL